MTDSFNTGGYLNEQLNGRQQEEKDESENRQISAPSESPNVSMTANAIEPIAGRVMNNIVNNISTCRIEFNYMRQGNNDNDSNESEEESENGIVKNEPGIIKIEPAEESKNKPSMTSIKKENTLNYDDMSNREFFHLWTGDWDDLLNPQVNGIINGQANGIINGYATPSQIRTLFDRPSRNSMYRSPRLVFNSPSRSIKYSTARPQYCELSSFMKYTRNQRCYAYQPTTISKNGYNKVKEFKMLRRPDQSVYTYETYYSVITTSIKGEFNIKKYDRKTGKEIIRGPKRSK
eukprot:299959_1